MRDELKNRVESNRNDWDIYDADLEGLWSNIESKLDSQEQKKYGSWGMWMKIAAAVVFAFGATWFALSIRVNNEYKDGYALHEISPELAETELYYTNEINERLRMIQTSNVELDDIIMENLALLDSAYSDLKLDLKDNIDNEEVIAEMIENYRIKLEILEQILGEIQEEVEDENEESDEYNI